MPSKSTRNSTTAVLLGLGLVACLTGSCLAATETYTVDPVHSSVLFRIRHLDVANIYGRFNDVKGEFTIDEETPANSRFEFEVPVESLDTGNDKRDQHVKGTDFLSAKEFPTIALESRKVEAVVGGGYLVVADLTLHGVTRTVPITIKSVAKAKGPMGAELAGFEVSVPIKRSDYGMGNMLELLGDEVTIIVSIEARRS